MGHKDVEKGLNKIDKGEKRVTGAGIHTRGGKGKTPQRERMVTG